MRVQGGLWEKLWENVSRSNGNHEISALLNGNHVSQAGVGPATYRLGGGCSIH